MIYGSSVPKDRSVQPAFQIFVLRREKVHPITRVLGLHETSGRCSKGPQRAQMGVGSSEVHGRSISASLLLFLVPFMRVNEGDVRSIKNVLTNSESVS